MFLKIVDIFFGFWGTFSISAEKLKKENHPRLISTIQTTFKKHLGMVLDSKLDFKDTLKTP